MEIERGLSTDVVGLVSTKSSLVEWVIWNSRPDGKAEASILNPYDTYHRDPDHCWNSGTPNVFMGSSG